MPRANQGGVKRGTGAITGLPAPQSKLGP